MLFAELISLPLALLVLLAVFRTVAAAALSVGVGALAVVTGIAGHHGAVARRRTSPSTPSTSPR